MPVVVTTDDQNKVGHYRVQRLKFTRDSGAAMSVAHKILRIFSHLILTKIDGTTVDFRAEVPAGVTVTSANGITTILIDNTILPASESVYIDCYVGAPARAV